MSYSLRRLNGTGDQNKVEHFFDLKSTCTLAMFEPEREKKVSADASSYGLGAVLRSRMMAVGSQ